MLSDLDQLPQVQLGDYVLRFELEDLTEFGKQVAAKELRETDDVKKEAIEELRELLKGEKGLSVPLDNDDWLVRFLRPCKFYPKSSFELIKRYYQFKVKHSDIYNDLMPSREENVFKSNMIAVFPNRDQLGRRVLLLELGKCWNHKKVSLDEVFKGCVLFLEAAMLEPETQVHGAVVIFDMNGLSLQQVWQFTPSFAKRIVDFLQECMPLRLKALHIINQPKIFNMVFALFKPFLKEKLRGRIVFHGTDMASFHQHMAPECLPLCYGGTVDAPRVRGEQWYELLMQCDKEYEAINSFGYKAELLEKENKENLKVNRKK
ncbi:alpha-tocopherol transfer protein isoform X2 [Culicoides brevitarsis]